MVTRRLIRWYWVGNISEAEFNTFEEAEDYAIRAGYGYIMRREQTPSGRILSQKKFKVYGIPETLEERRELDRKYKRNRGFAPFYPFLG
jgi:hypothetical protein